ncbi:MAG: DEAD/DEAH box helicase family protein, partial [Synergistaceae bacterium]|nr:DEAD/DEAH box helicase family protein [Synergistaceae bacterium]
MDLLPHNRAAYDAVVAHLEKSDRTCVVHPTGTGKSYIALQLIEDNPDARILYITSLATNLLEFWDKVDKLGRRMVLNLSNIPKHIGTGMKGDLDESDLITRDDEETAEIDDEQREELLKKATVIDESHMTGPLIQFCLYAGLSDLLPNFDFIIIDEFHRAGAPLWEWKVKQLLEDNQPAKVVGFSATPERMDGKDMRVLFNNDVASEMELSTAIINHLLPLPKYWLGKVEIDKYDENGLPKEKKKSRRQPTVAKRHLEAGDGLKDVFRDALIPENATHGKFIVFCRTIRNTKRMVKASEEWFDWVDEVHRYEMHSKDRDRFGDFVCDDSDTLRLLFVVDMLTEGVHLDDLDGVFMLRPTESVRIYFQQLGRALAVTTKREHPIILDVVSNAGVMREGLDFFRDIGGEMGMEED